MDNTSYDKSTFNSCLGIFKTKILDYNQIKGRAPFSEAISCPECGREGQFIVGYENRLANYCPDCEITWVYKLVRKEAPHG